MNKHKGGFTIIEIIIVVTMIAILAVLTIFAFSTWRARTAKTEMKDESAQAWIALKNYRVFNGSYPATQTAFNTVYKVGSAVTLTYTTPDSGTTYCIAATSVNDTSVWYVGSSTQQPTTTKPSNCP